MFFLFFSVDFTSLHTAGEKERKKEGRKGVDGWMAFAFGNCRLVGFLRLPACA